QLCKYLILSRCDLLERHSICQCSTCFASLSSKKQFFGNICKTIKCRNTETTYRVRSSDINASGCHNSPDQFSCLAWPYSCHISDTVQYTMGDSRSIGIPAII